MESTQVYKTIDDEGNGFLEVQGHIFRILNRKATEGDMVIITNTNANFSFLAYRPGEIFKVIERVRDGVYINHEWASDMDEESEPNILLYDFEYSVLEPTSKEAEIFKIFFKKARY